jgi:hypothetical protein
MSSEHIKGYIKSRLLYATKMEKPAATPEQIFAQYFNTNKNNLSPRQQDMLNYYTIVEQPSIIETLEKSLNISK